MTSEKLNFDIYREIEDITRIQQTEADIEYRKTISKLEDNFVKRSKYEIIEEIEDELRAYVWKYFEMCHILPSWPDSKPIMFSDDDHNIIGLPPISKDNILFKIVVKCCIIYNIFLTIYSFIACYLKRFKYTGCTL